LLHNIIFIQILTRPSDTKTKSIALRPATGIEMCDCPPKYKSESCQNPGKGFYRWYKEHFVTSITIVDLVGNAKKCECNGRTETCHQETGLCLVIEPKIVLLLCQIPQHLLSTRIVINHCTTSKGDLKIHCKNNSECLYCIVKFY
jgi:hypothetical protein